MLATTNAAVNSELQSDWSFVIGEPAVSRKIGNCNDPMTLAAHEWKQPSGTDKGLYAKVLLDQTELDIDLANFHHKVGILQSRHCK
jgi:methylglutaconyl-CoA hydratase